MGPWRTRKIRKMRRLPGSNVNDLTWRSQRLTSPGANLLELFFVEMTIHFARGAFVDRATVIIMLASFLRLQVGCCCADHGEGVTAAQEATACRVGHGDLTSATRHASNDRHVVGDWLTSHTPGSELPRQCPLCVIADQKYLAAPAVPALDLAAVGLPDCPSKGGGAAARRRLVDAASDVSGEPPSLLACGSLLRI